MASKPLTKELERQRERDSALETLRRCYPEGSTVYGIVRSVSRSGMSRVISIIAIGGTCALHPNYATAIVTDMRLKTVDGSDGVVSNGCGFHHLHAIASDISRALYGRDDALRYEYL